MAEPTQSKAQASVGRGSSLANKQPPKTPLHKIYALPAPIRTFPLPSFYPSNPLSLAHVALVWLRHLFARPADEPSRKYGATWSAETRSVHVADAAAMRALWEHGFFGKGSLSRSEPNWLKREQIRQGLVAGNVQEQLTNERREARLRAKWERARLEQEAIERTRQEETRAALSSAQGPVPNGVVVTGTAPNSKSRPGLLAPVGPFQLLQLPNSEVELRAALELIASVESDRASSLLCSKHSASGGDILVDESSHEAQGSLNGTAVKAQQNGGMANGDAHAVRNKIEANGHIAKDATATKAGEPMPLKRQKSVRFSPEVESTTFQRNDPPSPDYSTPLPPSLSETDASPLLELRDGMAAPEESAAVNGALKQSSRSAIDNKEHLQLSPEEAFYLVFAIGALSVVDPATKSELSTLQLLYLFADHSFFPPRIPCGNPATSSGLLQTDDPFLVQYVVYHHFRSLGWIPREGVKFGVDWMLYAKGPVFDHAEFGLVVLPSYTDPLWKDQPHRTVPVRSWHWLLGVQRVLAHTLKSLVLIYVDIPPPSALDGISDAEGGGITGLLKRYKVREVMVRRWSSNRNR